MGELKELYRAQQKAQKMGDFVKLNEINKQIYTIREQRRKEKARARQEEQDKQTAKQIENILNK